MMHASMLTVVVLYTGIELYKSCSLTPREVNGSWAEVLEKKISTHSSFLSTTNLSFIPSHAFVGFNEVVVSDNFDQIAVTHII